MPSARIMEIAVASNVSSQGLKEKNPLSQVFLLLSKLYASKIKYSVNTYYAG